MASTEGLSGFSLICNSIYPDQIRFSVIKFLNHFVNDEFFSPHRVDIQPNVFSLGYTTHLWSTRVRSKRPPDSLHDWVGDFP